MGRDPGEVLHKGLSPEPAKVVWKAETAKLVELEFRPSNGDVACLIRLPLELLRAYGRCHALGPSGSSLERRGAMEDFLDSYSVILRLAVSLSPVCGEAFLVVPATV